MKKRKLSPLQEFLLAAFADRLGKTLAKGDVVAIIVCPGGIMVQLSAAGLRKARARLMRGRPANGVHLELSNEGFLAMFPVGQRQLFPPRHQMRVEHAPSLR